MAISSNTEFPNLDDAIEDAMDFMEEVQVDTQGIEPIEDEVSPKISLEEIAKRNAEAQRKHFIHLLDNAGVPLLYRDAKLETNCQIYREEASKVKALEMTEHLVRNGRIVQRDAVRFCLVLTGDFGGGKTWLGTAAFKELLWKHKSGIWRKFHQFIREMQDTYAHGNTYESLQRFQKTPVLMLDDIGDLESSESDNRRQLLYEVIDYRNDWMLQTIITTNLNEGQLVAQFGERTYNRLIEMAALVGIKGRNMRLEPKASKNGKTETP